MSQSSSQARDAAPPSRVTRALLSLFMRPARVAAVETLAPHFRVFDLEGEELRNIDWAVGQKIQVAIGSGLSARTYTPITWDAERGSTRILAFAHGDSPGSHWASTLRAGDTCQFFGPRRSLDLSEAVAKRVLFGDETSFGLAAALRDSTSAVLEATDAVESRTVLEATGIGHSTLIERTAADTHLAAIEAEVTRLAASGAHFILTGKASSIQRVSRALKSAGVASSRIKTKAYWAPGKVGMD